LDSISPTEVKGGGQSFVVLARGANFGRDAILWLDGKPLKSTWLSEVEVMGRVSGLSRGKHQVVVKDSGGQSQPKTLEVDNTPPSIAALSRRIVNEDQKLEFRLAVEDIDKDPVRVFVQGLPPGARWDEVTRTLTFVPDFIQGGTSWKVTFVATDGSDSTTREVEIQVNNSIRPPVPAVTKREQFKGYERLTIAQKTDSYLDSPGYAGRSFKAMISAPTDTGKKHPVRVFLHGFGGSPATAGSNNQFRIYAHDSMNSYWWGYSDQLPKGKPTTGTVVNYTQRRVLHLLEWVLKTYPHADPERVYVTGGSMGGAGAKTLGLLYARHFAYVQASIGQAIPRNHRPSRINQLQTLWGTPKDNLPYVNGKGVWDHMDLTRVLRDSKEARNQYIDTLHGKDDPVIHFGAMVIDSPLTSLSFYKTMQQLHIGHMAAWDERGHGGSGPVMGSNWYANGWDRIFHSTTYLRRDLAFVAFSNSSFDNDPGTGKGNGKKKWSAQSGYAADSKVAGDCGWNGEIAGVLNRYLRWDSTKIVDTAERFSIPLRVHQGTGSPSPKPGYPPKGYQLPKALPIVVDVTPRRVQRFAILPQETVQWSFGKQKGQVKANADGEVTIPQLSLTHTWTLLTLQRIP
jgi:poly(3-hydroxybutyrate) depolymerase